jgi:hypothetical protein
MAQLELFHNGSDTSRDAARSMDPHAGNCRRAILDHIRAAPDGATCDEIEHALRMRHQNVSARLRELSLEDLVRDSGDRRPTRSGRRARVYVATGSTPTEGTA